MAAMEGIDAAYYLVHSMGASTDFSAKDREAATTFPRRGRRGAPRRIVYLGGLGHDDDPDLSAHLKSRHEVGRVLAEGPVPVTELPRRGDHRFRQRELRDAALPHRGPAGHDLPPLGAQPLSADRHRRRAVLPRRRAGRRPRRGAGPRSRRARRPQLPRHDAHLRRGGGAPPATDPARPGLVTEPVVALDRPRDPAAHRPRPAAGGESDQRGRGR